jgi:cytochrome c biogenesis protein CcdA
MGSGRKSRALITIIVLIILFTASIRPVWGTSDKISIEYFHKPKCKTCGGQLNSEGFDAIIRDLEDEYGPQIETEWIDLNEDENLVRIMDYNITLSPAVVFNREYHLVRDEITPESLRETVNALLDPRSTPPPMGGLAKISLPVILVSGLVDGFNPCAFSLLIFFISFLLGLQKTRGNILRMGTAYIAGNFIMYLALGLGLLQAISFLGIEHPVGKLGTALLIVLGLLNLRDAFSWGEDLLKFPKRAVPTVKSLINKGIVPAALVLGGFVSMLEFACSGGVYVGILVLLSSSARFWEGVGYLLLYNLAFVAPLVVILLLGTQAETLARIDEWRVIRRRQMKAIGGAFMIILGIVTYYWVFMG